MKKDANKLPAAAKSRHLVKKQRGDKPPSPKRSSLPGKSARAEQTLIGAGEDKFENIFNHANDGIVLADPENKKIFMGNNAICRMLGYSPEEIAKLNVMDIHPEKDLPYVMEQFQRQAREDFTLAKDLPIKRKDGSVFYADINATVMTISGKKYIAGFFHDITEHKQAEKTLQESEKRYRTVLEASFDLIYIIGRDDTVQYVNPAALKALGRPAAEVNGKSRASFFPPEVAARQKLSLDRVFATGEPQFVVQTTEQKGIVHWQDTHLIPLNSSGGRVDTVLGISRDVTECKRAEQALLFKTMLLEAQSETSIDGILAVDDEGHVILFNQRFGELWQIPRQVLDTKDDAKLLAYVAQQLKDPAEFSRRVAYLYEHHDEKSRDEINLVDGKYFDRYSAPLIDAAGKHHGRIWYFRDITKRKQAENKIRELNASLEGRIQERTAELMHANQELEMLIRITSHDLRSPLVNIQGFNQLLNKACGAISRILADAVLPDETRQALVASHEKAEKAIRFINAGVEKMNGLIGGLLRLSKLGHAVLTIKTLDMNALLQTVLKAMEFQIRAAAAKVSVDDLPACRADAGLINQAFSNLLDNAIKYRDPARPLCVHIRGRHPGGGLGEDARAVYCIEDNGQGVAPEHQQKIWDLFYRPNPQGNVAGEGVGLTTVKRIVELNGGTVWMESESGKGSRFFLALPAAGEKAET